MRSIKALVVALLLFSAPNYSSAAVTIVQTSTAEDGVIYAAGVNTHSFSSSCTTGNTVIVVFTSTHNTRTVTSVVLGSDAMTQRASQQGGIDGYMYSRVCSTPTANITVTLSGSTFDGDFTQAIELAGMPDPTVIDDSATNTTSATTTHSSTDVVTTVNETILIGLLSNTTGSAIWTDDGSFTNIGQETNGTMRWSYRIVTGTTVTEAWNLTSSANEDTVLDLVAFQGTVGGGGSSRCCGGALRGLVH